MAGISIDKVQDFQREFLDRMRTAHADTLEVLGSGKLSEEAVATIERVASDICLQLGD